KKINNIMMFGRHDRESVNVIMTHAQAVIESSSWYETFGMVVIEAYASRTPVIAANFGNVGDLVEDGRTGFKYRQDSPDALNLAVERMERLDQADYEQMRQAAYKEYLERYSTEKNYNILKGIYEKSCC
ncbi:MAG: glycosyltransferase family 4 protein, partial [Lachnospiraceae bacterium]|nr:glycosyltransferase family 4 protein [Lachnospiraceae bacterium]